MRIILAGFSKLSYEERKEWLKRLGLLSENDLLILNKDSALSFELADHFIENLIGTFPLPLGVAINFVIDGKEMIIPMAIEESSVVAAASKTAKWIRENGEINTQTLSKLGLGQIQIPRVSHFDDFKNKILIAKDDLIAKVNTEVLASLVQRGGGLRDLQVRCLARGDGDNMGVVHVLVDTCDAMGANVINQVCEFLKPHIQNITDEKVGMCILSNVPDTKITRAEVIIRDIEPALGRAICEGSLFAHIDPFRAATNNKGVMNGMDGVLIATGNDWRAVEAGVHAYAGLQGQYTSITRWEMRHHDLHGVLAAPILVGTVGGVTRLHPVAQICLKLLGVNSAEELARVVAAVGLVQNLGALRALMTDGITRGHMLLHIENIAIASGANNTEIVLLKSRLAKRLIERGRISASDARELLAQLRNKLGECHDDS